MKRFLSFLLFAALYASSVSAQYFPVDTAMLNSAYRAIVKGPNTLEKQLNFLTAFPTTYMEYFPFLKQTWILNWTNKM